MGGSMQYGAGSPVRLGVVSNGASTQAPAGPSSQAGGAAQQISNRIGGNNSPRRNNRPGSANNLGSSQAWR
jgi:hypothetical protein